MDGQQYLNQITESNRPMQKAGKKEGKLKKIISSKFFIIGAIAVAALVLIMILGSLLSGGKKSEKSMDIDLLLHVGNVAEAIEEYKNDIRSSDLRSSASSLQSVLNTTETDLTGYMEQKYNFKTKEIEKKVTEAAALERDNLINELFEAKINGILDRIFAHKMTYEITMIMSEENKLSDTTNNQALQELLDKSHESLNTLYDKFNDFSETK